MLGFGVWFLVSALSATPACIPARSQHIRRSRCPMHLHHCLPSPHINEEFKTRGLLPYLLLGVVKGSSAKTHRGQGEALKMNEDVTQSLIPPASPQLSTAVQYNQISSLTLFYHSPLSRCKRRLLSGCQAALFCACNTTLREQKSIAAVAPSPVRS